MIGAGSEWMSNGEKTIAKGGSPVSLPIPMSELNEYRQTVERFARAKSSEIFPNGRHEHATIILETFFAFAAKKVSIFCNEFSQCVFGVPSLAQKLEEALLRGVAVDIIVQKEPEAVELVGLIDVWKKDSRMAITLERARVPYCDVEANFATMDGEAYRFEANRDKPIAVACMYNPRIAGLFERLFYSVFKSEDETATQRGALTVA